MAAANRDNSSPLHGGLDRPTESTSSGGGTVSFMVTADDTGVRVDRFLARLNLGLSRSRIQALIRESRATVNAEPLTDASLKLKAGDAIVLELPAPVAAEPAAEPMPLAVVYEDDALIVIDKPAGLVVHPSAGHEEGTLVNALIAHCGETLSGIGGVRRPGIVHRLDKDTTGLIVAAKSDAAHAGLAAQFAAHGRDGRLDREYVAIVWGQLPAAVGSIDAPVTRSSVNRTRMQVAASGSRARIGRGGAWIDDIDQDDEFDGAISRRAPREAITHYHVEEVFSRPQLRDAPREHDRTASRSMVALASLVRVSLETGRTHQIRVHMAHIGHPVLGDPVYGAGFKSSERRLDEPQSTALTRLGRQALHATVLGFEHPITGAPMRFESLLPADMAELVGALRGSGSRAAVPSRRGRKPVATKGILPVKRKRLTDVQDTDDLDET